MPHKNAEARRAYMKDYIRQRRSGRCDPETQRALFEAVIFLDPLSGCWLWCGGANQSTGYGSFSPRHGRTEMAHRIAYELARGPIPPGLVIDHRCKVRLCVNPAHLEAVTQQVNWHRSLNNPHNKPT